MREIKFRFYYKNKRIEELTLEQIGDKCSFHWADDVVICQYTGLKDKNGKEIYEGDIVKFVSTGFGTGYGVKDWVSPVTFEYGQWMVWQRWDSKSGHGHCLGTIESDEFTREVIGNIYENPELMEAF